MQILIHFNLTFTYARVCVHTGAWFFLSDFLTPPQNTGNGGGLRRLSSPFSLIYHMKKRGLEKVTKSIT